MTKVKNSRFPGYAGDPPERTHAPDALQFFPDLPK